MIHRSDIPYRELSIEERPLLIENIWDSIAADAESVPLTDAQRAEICKRLTAHRADPDAAVSWEGEDERSKSIT